MAVPLNRGLAGLCIDVLVPLEASFGKDRILLFVGLFCLLRCFDNLTWRLGFSAMAGW